MQKYYCQFDPTRERARVHHRSSSSRSTAETLEYWFSDANLGYDEFMREHIREGQGWVDLDVLLTFRTLIDRNFDKESLVSLVQKCRNLKLNNDKTKVCRRYLVDWFVSEKLDYFKVEHKQRTVVVIDFKEDLNGYDMKKYFGPHRHSVEYYTKRMHDEPKVVFAQFFNKKDADEFLGDRNMKIWRNCRLWLLTRFEYEEKIKNATSEAESSGNTSALSNSSIQTEYSPERKVISFEREPLRFMDYLASFFTSKISSVD